MASGIDDEVTLRANREGFLKFELRPRRLVDVSKVDMSADILGVNTTPRSSSLRSAGTRPFTRTAKWPSRGRPKPATTCRSCRPRPTTSPEDVIAARGAPIWYQLYATNNWDISKAFVTRAESAGCLAVAVTVDRNGGRNQETLFRLQRTDTRDCTACHDRSTR